LIGYFTGPIAGKEPGRNPYIINNTKCLTPGYKFNDLHVFALPRDYLESTGIDNLVIKESPASGNCVIGCVTIEVEGAQAFYAENITWPFGGYVKDSNPLIKEKIEYSIDSYGDGKLVLRESKKTSEYETGARGAVKSFWYPISCFFKRLFGGSC